MKYRVIYESELGDSFEEIVSVKEKKYSIFNYIDVDLFRFVFNLFDIDLVYVDYEEVI